MNAKTAQIQNYTTKARKVASLFLQLAEDITGMQTVYHGEAYGDMKEEFTTALENSTHEGLTAQQIGSMLFEGFGDGFLALVETNKGVLSAIRE